MTTRTWGRTLITLTLVLAILWSCSMVVLAAQKTTGSLTVNGEVSINGTRAISGTTVFSDSTVTTAKGSSAVVSLGKLGRVEVLPDSRVNLSFNEAGVTCKLESGRVRVSTSSGVNASVTTVDGVVVAVAAQANTFTVDMTCGNTVVSTQAGRVELRFAGGSDVKQIAAGERQTAGRPILGSPCASETMSTKNGLGSVTITALLLAAGVVIATVILLGPDNAEPAFTNSTPNFSPS